MTPALKPELHQWFTPHWVCEAVIERHFAHLTSSDTVLEPSCGEGRFLAAVPAHVGAIGVEIDPDQAERARQRTGRQVITSDFLTAELPVQITHAVGNPPFNAGTVHSFMEKIHALLPEGGTCGMLLPAYIFQTSSKVLELHKKWSIDAELLPRNIFQGLSLPLVFSMFRKQRERTLVGFFLYRETGDVVAMPADVRAAIDQPVKGGVWRRAVWAAFKRVGSRAVSLDQLYAAVERPTENQFWRQQVRKVLQSCPEFKSQGAGRWEIGVPA